MSLRTMTRSSLPTVNVLFLAILYLSVLVCVRAQYALQADDFVGLKQKQARVRIVNQSGRYIAPGIRVVHKYSSKYKHDLKFEKGLNDGEVDEADGFQRVTYEVGGDTFGKDWWYITFVFPDEPAIYETSPDNFECFLNFLEKIAPTVLAFVAGEVAGALACGFPPVTGCAAAPAAAYAAGLLAEGIARELLNMEGTCGMKQCILREQDAASVAWVTIYIKKNGQLTIDVPSGAANTKYSLLKVLPNGSVVPQSAGAIFGTTDSQAGESLDGKTFSA